MVAEARRELEQAGVEEPIGTALAAGGYWNSVQISAIRASGIEVIAPTKDRQRTKPRKYAPPQGREAERIETLLSKPEGKALYRRRQQLVEPVFADTKFNRRADRFMRRGLGACNSEWRADRGDTQPLKALARRSGCRQGGHAGRNARLRLRRARIPARHDRHRSQPSGWIRAQESPAGDLLRQPQIAGVSSLGADRASLRPALTF